MMNDMNQFSHAPYMFIFASICLMLIIRTRSWEHHKLPLIIIGYFYILLGLKLLQIEYFRVIHDCMVFALIIISHKLYNREKYVNMNNELKINIIPTIIVIMYLTLEITRLHYDYLFYKIHALLIALILLFLITAPLYLIYCKYNDKKSKLSTWVY